MSPLDGRLGLFFCRGWVRCHRLGCQSAVAQGGDALDREHLLWHVVFHAMDWGDVGPGVLRAGEVEDVALGGCSEEIDEED